MKTPFIAAVKCKSPRSRTVIGSEPLSSIIKISAKQAAGLRTGVCEQPHKRISDHGLSRFVDARGVVNKRIFFAPPIVILAERPARGGADSGRTVVNSVNFGERVAGE